MASAATLSSPDEQFRIVRNASPPPGNWQTSHERESRYPFSQLDVGDALDVFGGIMADRPDGGCLRHDRVSAAARAYGRKEGKRFVVRTLANRVRVWRLS
jgi:hypothetical protein